MAALALLLVAGAAAGVTLGLTRGHKTQAATGGSTTDGGRVDGGQSGDGKHGERGQRRRSHGRGERYRSGTNPNYIQVAPNGKFAYVTDPGAGDDHRAQHGH